tara:strand:- start:6363 stop:6752 length:390 start_codon:yes stop_codon:yes gene_type:complete
MNSNDNELSKILVNGLLQKFFKNVEKNFHIIGLINMMTIAIPTILFNDNDKSVMDDSKNTVICNILENINEIPSNLSVQIDYQKTELYEIKNILENSINKWVNKGYTFQEIFFVFQRIKVIISGLSLTN